MKKIIVPIDFSEFSENALKTAVHIAKRDNAEILAIHMLELSEAMISQSESVNLEQTAFYLKLAEKRFSEFLDKDYLKDVTVTPVVKHYKIFSELNEIAKSEKADLIVMGSHGASGLKELFVGSNTERVVRSSTVPVLVVKGLAITSDFNSAIFACDFSAEDVAPYLKARTFLESLGCVVRLLHVNTPYANFRSTAEQQNRVVKFLERANVSTSEVENVAYTADYSVEDGILEYANVSGADLIVVATHGRRGLSHFFEGSISEDVANHSTLPVLTFKI